VPGAQFHTINKPVSYAMKITLARARYRWGDNIGIDIN
jgi:hypothetical protein